MDNNGVVTPKSPGAATITVTTEDGNKTASATVTVTGEVKSSTPPAEQRLLENTNANVNCNTIYNTGKIARTIGNARKASTRTNETFSDVPATNWAAAAINEL